MARKFFTLLVEDEDGDEGGGGEGMGLTQPGAGLSAFHTLTRVIVTTL